MAAVWFETRFEIQCMHGVTRGSQSQPGGPPSLELATVRVSLAAPCPATRSALRPAPRSRVYPPSASVADGRRCTREAAGGRGGAALVFKEVLDVDSTSHRLPSLW